MSDSTRIVDLRVSRLTISFIRYVYRMVGAWTLVQRRRNQRIMERTAHELGADAVHVIVAAQRKLSDGAAPGLSNRVVNTGFVIYSALR